MKPVHYQSVYLFYFPAKGFYLVAPSNIVALSSEYRDISSYPILNGTMSQQNRFVMAAA
jgi:hypothetical protein